MIGSNMKMAWPQAESKLEEMRAAKVQPNLITYNALKLGFQRQFHFEHSTCLSKLLILGCSFAQLDLRSWEGSMTL